ncbi:MULTISPECIES: TonB-dependent receptor [Sphingobacterium]|uniref:TonB-dependent receptor n=1 Tax=Sphingobacterium TaxID=28453 RepID=UPI0008A286D7|nr:MULTISPECIES: TonB-dependent receptor [Sphingobacterium]OFV14364.1 hypothetical protein HMPREF3127_13350 [Sphingobacterium sp. HMSC13C05]
MKLTALFLVLATVHISAKSFGQKVTLKEKNTTLEKIFNKISAQTGYDFLYTKKSIGKSDRASIEVENVDLSQALTQLLKEKSLKFSIEDQIIVVTKSSSASQAGSTGGENLVQTNDINGKISDRKGAPVAGATVRLKRTGQSIASNEHGIFLLKGARIGDELIVSYTGYETVTMPITSYESLTIILNETIQELDEVVLVGYGAVKRKDLTGAVSTISGKIFANMPVMRVDQMMQGRASGVDVKSSNGAPGAGTSIRIRGARSISATNEPLYVVDGLIDATNLNTLNPEDIESIDILKDASATAIYGSRAANGVVLITTKQGKANQDNTNVSTITGIQQLPKRLKLMNARQFTQFINESRLDQNRAVVYPNIDSVINIVGEKGTDWTDETMRTGIYQSYNASTSGGSEKFTYFISGNMIDQKGIVKGTDMAKFQGRINMNKRFSDQIRMGLNLNASRYKINSGNVNYGANAGWPSSMITLPPTMPVRKPDGSFESYNPIWYSGGDVDTPPVVAELTENANTVNDLQANLFIEAELIKGLKLKSAFGTSLSNNKNVYFVPSFMPSKIATKNTTANASSGMGTSTYWLNENTLNYDRNWDLHHLNLLGGFTMENRQNSTMGISVTGLTDDIMKYNNFASADQVNRTVSSNAEKNSRVSYLGRINYDFDSKYYLTMSGRYDGASNFAMNNKWGFFPSFGVKWRVSNESFFKESEVKKTISDMGFRFSYGKSGNQGIGNYQSLATLAPNSKGYIFGENPVLGYTQSSMDNPNLTWETSSQIDLGFDMSLWNGRLTIDVNYYKTNTKDLLLNVQIPQQTGFSSRLVNLGKTVSQGFELMVSGDMIAHKDFNWKSTLTLSTNSQEIKDIGPLVMVSIDNNGYGANTNYLKVGVPIGANFGAIYGGVWHNQQEIDEELARTAGSRKLVSPSGFYKPGKPRYVDQNGDGLLNIDDYMYLGTPNPKLYGGFGNTFTYKNLSLDLFLQYNQGNTMYNAIEFFMGSGAEFTNQFAYMADRWTPSNTGSDIPMVNSRDNVPSSRFLHDASFIRLKSLQLSYNLKSLFPKTFKSASVYVTGTNLLLLTKYNGFDPEVNGGGTSSTIRAKDDGTYPNARTYALGINVGF